MGGAIIYFTVAFVIFFFTYRKYNTKVKEYVDERYSNLAIESKYAWVMVMIPLFWVVSLPMILIWTILNKITK